MARVRGSMVTVKRKRWKRGYIVAGAVDMTSGRSHATVSRWLPRDAESRRCREDVSQVQG